jgi:hypothetical protein
VLFAPVRALCLRASGARRAIFFFCAGEIFGCVGSYTRRRIFTLGAEAEMLLFSRAGICLFEDEEGEEKEGEGGKGG